MKEPRPATISARPFEMRSRVAKFWKTRTGSAALRTVTAEVRRMVVVGSGCGEDDGGGRVEVFAAVMLAEAEDVEANLVGYLDLFKEMGDALLSGDRVAGDGVWNQRCEAVDADLHCEGFPLCVNCLTEVDALGWE